ncbi:hypothetical protein [Roseisolibacter agri]|uniref:Uncharacterized protein n=1 Tax=Roseisolibacter agri TaxID=2014610 RepID=A0AA37Q9Y2_9BACT|nr:hypothetical protein [Roseisolibacter agri]GLC25056.1 hypothetical protein rosag_15690 [Roseisolibacter agri]
MADASPHREHHDADPPLHLEKRSGSDRRRPAISRDADGYHISTRALAAIVAVVTAVSALWVPLKAVWKITELPRAFEQLSGTLGRVDSTLIRFGTRFDVMERDVTDLKQLAPRVQQLETRAAGYDAAKSAADALHEREERRLTALEQERRRGGGS